MNVSLKVTYRTTWLPIICSFVGETARAYGADDTERDRLHLAAEETAMHIMESIPHDELEDAFEVTCVPHGDGVEFVFNNLGPPINVAALPVYDSETPEASLDGLRLFLARKMVDRLEFINQGRDGWRTTFFKRLQAMKPPAAPAQVADVPSPEAAPAPVEPVTSCIARSEDAFEIVQMAYQNYRYSYANESFYFAEKLELDLASGRVVSFISRAKSGPIVGHIALFKNDRSPTVREVGAVMVRPDYRRSRALLSLLKTTLRHQSENPEILDHYTSNLVTAHTLSQKLAATMGLKPMALHVSTHARARFLGIQTTTSRESNLYAISVQRPQPPVPLAVPPEHAGLAGRLFANLGLTVVEAVAPECDPSAPVAAPVWTARYDARSNYATLAVDGYGADFASALRSEVYKISLEKADTLALRLPAWLPLPPDLDAELRRQSFFFCGFVLRDASHWYLAYARLLQQHFTFDDIQVFDPLAEELKAYVSGCHQKLINTEASS